MCVRSSLWSTCGRFHPLTYIFIAGNGNEAQIWKNVAYTNKPTSVRVIKILYVGMHELTQKCGELSLTLITAVTKLESILIKEGSSLQQEECDLRCLHFSFFPPSLSLSVF